MDRSCPAASLLNKKKKKSLQGWCDCICVFFFFSNMEVFPFACLSDGQSLTVSLEKYFSSVKSGLGAGNSCWYYLC